MANKKYSIIKIAAINGTDKLRWRHIKVKTPPVTKINWSYDSKIKEWYTGESVAYANDGYSIKKEDRPWDDRKYSIRDNTQILGRFYTLTAAKTVANLLKFGK